MREIKFRAYDPERKRMVLDAKWVEWRVDMFGVLRAVNYDFGGKEQHLTVMQYTGLEDKNGVEIYEGDQYKHLSTGSVGVIRYVDGSFYCDHPDLHAYSVPNINNGMVIGNIYEHQHLLEAK